MAKLTRLRAAALSAACSSGVRRTCAEEVGTAEELGRIKGLTGEEDERSMVSSRGLIGLGEGGDTTGLGGVEGQARSMAAVSVGS